MLPFTSWNLNAPVPLLPPVTNAVCSLRTKRAAGKLPLSISIPAIYPKDALTPAPASPSFVIILSAIVVSVDSTVVVVPLTSKSPLITVLPCIPELAPAVVSSVIVPVAPFATTIL